MFKSLRKEFNPKKYLAKTPSEDGLLAERSRCYTSWGQFLCLGWILHVIQGYQDKEGLSSSLSRKGFHKLKLANYH